MPGEALLDNHPSAGLAFHQGAVSDLAEDGGGEGGVAAGALSVLQAGNRRRCVLLDGEVFRHQIRFHRAFESLIIVGAIYFVLTFSLSKLVGAFERRLKQSD